VKKPDTHKKTCTISLLCGILKRVARKCSPLKAIFSPGAVVHACNPSLSGGRDWEDYSSGQKFMKTTSQPIKDWAWWDAPFTLATAGNVNTKIMVQATPDRKQDPIEKITKA
jgi:hypothetical protein